MQAVFRLIQCHKGGRTRAEQCDNQTEKPQRAIRKLGALQRTQNALARHQHLETAILHIDIKLAVGKCLFHHLRQEFGMTALNNGRPGRRQIAAIMAQHRRTHANLRCPYR